MPCLTACLTPYHTLFLCLLRLAPLASGTFLLSLKLILYRKNTSRTTLNFSLNILLKESMKFWERIFRFWEGILIWERILDFCEGLFIKDFVIPSQSGKQGPLPCFTRGDFAANTGWFWFEKEFIDFCEGISIKDFVIPSQGGTQWPMPCFTRGNFAANTGIKFDNFSLNIFQKIIECVIRFCFNIF